jgi:hypothetical protein
MIYVFREVTGTLPHPPFPQLWGKRRAIPIRISAKKIREKIN